MNYIKKIGLFFCLLVFAIPLFSQQCFQKGNNENWSSAFVGIGIKGGDIMASASGSKGIYCLTQDQQTTTFGGQSTNIAVNLWNGKTWRSIGPAFPYTGSYLYLIGIEMVGDTMLIISGKFASSTLNSPGIVKLNLITEKYEAIALGVYGLVQRTKVYKDTMYVLGNFTQVMDSSKTMNANNVARYYFKTNTWDTLESGLGGFSLSMGSNIDYEAYCNIEIKPDGEVLFSGKFNKAGNVNCGGIASWKTGRGWNGLFGGGSKQYNGTFASNGIVFAMNYSERDTALYITGQIGYNMNPSNANKGKKWFAKYRDTAWTKAKESNWNYDSAWNYNFTGMQDILSATSYLDTASQKIYYGSINSGNINTQMKIFDIKKQTFEIPNKGLSGKRVSGINKWDNKIFAAGLISQADSTLWVEDITYFENGKWNTLGKGFSSNNLTQSVTTLVEDNKKNLIVGGVFNVMNGMACNSIAQVDTNFNIKPLNNKLIPNTPNGFVYIKHILVLKDNLYIVGDFRGADTMNSQGIIGYDQTNDKWFKLGNSGVPYNKTINTIVYFDGKIVVGGSFSSINGVTADNLAFWDGSKWNAMGNPDGEVRKLALLDDTTLIVSGSFYNINSKSISNMATYFKSGLWSQLGNSGYTASASNISVNKKEREIWIPYTSIISQYSGKGSSAYFSANGYAVYKDSVWQDYGKLIGNNNNLHIYHDSSGNAFLNGVFSGVITDSAAGILSYSSRAWSGMGKGIKTNKYLANPYFYAAINWNKHLVVGGTFENSGNGQVSFNLAAYKLDKAGNATLTINLGKDTAAYYGYSLMASVNGSYDSLIWSDGAKNVEYTNVYKSDNYVLTAYNNGCLVKDTAYITIKGNNIYAGGKGDGFSSDVYAQNATMPGGKGDGFSSGIYAQNAKMSGGNGDGFSSEVFAQNSKMPGGKGDGFASRIVTDNRTIFKGGKGDGFAMATYVALPDGTIRKIITPLIFQGKDSVELATWVHNIGGYPIYGFKVNWFVAGSLYTFEEFAKDSIMPSDSMSVKAKLKFMPKIGNLPLDMCVLVCNIAKEKDTTNNQFCYILDKNTTSITSDKNKIFDLNVYPNPTSDIAWLAITANDVIESNFQLINNEGKIILDKNLSATSTKIEIDVRDIAAGIYHFVYLRGANKITGKIAIIR